MQTKNFLIVAVAMMWQMATAQENYPGFKLAPELGSLLDDIPISNSAPDLPVLPELRYIRGWLPPGHFGYPPSLPSDLGGGFDYPCFGEPLPYLKKKKGCRCLVKQACLLAKLRKCGSKRCYSKENCRLKEKEEFGSDLKIEPLIKPFTEKKKKLQCNDDFENLPCELPNILSGLVRGSLYND